MPKIKFGTGQTVNFQNNPTPQDIEEVANKLNINKPVQPNGFLEKNSQAVNKVGNVLGDIAKKAIQAPVRLASRAGQLGALGVAKALPGLFDYNKAVDEVNKRQTVPGLNIDVNPISEETPETVAGQGISTVALGLGNPTLGGALGAGGYAMQEKGSPLKVAGYTAAGGLLGYGAGKLSGAISHALSPATDDVSNTLIQTGVSSHPQEASQITGVLHDLGITKVSTPRDIAIGRNIIEQALNDAKLNQAFDQIPALQSAQRALEMISRVPSAPPIEPGILSKVASRGLKAVKGLGLFGLGTGAAMLGNYLSGGNNPKEVIKKTISSGGL